jgi:hypothetical protein
MDSRHRIFLKLFLRFPSPMQTRSAPSFLISKKSLKFDGGYWTCASSAAHVLSRTKISASKLKRSRKKLCGPGICGRILLWRKYFVAWCFTKTVQFTAEAVTSHWWDLFFPILLHCESLTKPIMLSLRVYLQRGWIFRQQLYIHVYRMYLIYIHIQYIQWGIRRRHWCRGGTGRYGRSWTRCRQRETEGNGRQTSW